MPQPTSYQVPWEEVFRFGPHVLRGTRSDMGAIYHGFVSRMLPAPLFRGLEHLPRSPRFVLAANYYQRKGLWIAHVASVLASAMANRYPCTPPMRWLVTANESDTRRRPLAVRSPRELLLPRLAHAAWCYPVPFADSNPQTASSSLRELLNDAGHLHSPVGIFPEGGPSTSGTLGSPLPGIGRLFKLLAQRGCHVQPAGVSEAGRIIVKFGPLITLDEILCAPDAGRLVLSRIGDLT